MVIGSLENVAAVQKELEGPKENVSFPHLKDYSSSSAECTFSNSADRRGGTFPISSEPINVGKKNIH